MPARMRHVRAIAVVMGCASLALAVSLPAQASTPHGKGAERTVLAPGDGWAAAEGSTTGGAKATPDHVYTVTNRAELIAAFEDAGDAPKIVRIAGTVHGNSDAAGDPDRLRGLPAGRLHPGEVPRGLRPRGLGQGRGPLRPAGGRPCRVREASGRGGQRERPVQHHAHRGKQDATVVGASLQVKNVSNVIIRNLTFEDTYDCFPQWDPTDGDTGHWNSEYDNLVVYGSRHVWVDHNTFSDGDRPDADQPRYFDELFQQHDGLFDIVRGADLVTVSWNVLKDHDKTMLIGNSDGAGADDRGKLRVTLHHNLFKDVNERAPRVRFGQVDSYNNHFVATAGAAYGYTYGIGAESHLVAEHNAFSVPKGFDKATILKKWSESSLTAA